MGPVVGDGYVDLPEVPMAMSESTANVLEQGFVELHRRLTHQASRLQDGSDNVAEQTRLMFLEEKTKVGTREAAAMQRMDSDKLAAQILQQRSAGMQPQAAGGPAPVKPA